MTSVDVIHKARPSGARPINGIVSISWLQQLYVFLGSLVIVIAAYFISLEWFFPKYFEPLLPVHKDTFDHWSIGTYSWQIVLAGPRPVAWILMKLVAPLGLEATTALPLLATIVGITIFATVMRSMLSLSLKNYLIALPVYAFALFCHPEFYVKHRDDFELEVSFILFALAVLLFDMWLKKRKSLLYIGFVASLALFPFAKETFWIAGPVFYSLTAAINRFTRARVTAAILCIVAVVIAYATLKTNSVFFNQGTGPYRPSFEVSSILNLFLGFLKLAFTFPTACLCIVGFWNLRTNLKGAAVAASALIAGMSAYAPNSIFPDHFLNWYAWDGLPLLLAPILASINLPRGSNAER